MIGKEDQRRTNLTSLKADPYRPHHKVPREMSKEYETDKLSMYKHLEKRPDNWQRAIWQNKRSITVVQ